MSFTLFFYWVIHRFLLIYRKLALSYMHFRYFSSSLFYDAEFLKISQMGQYLYLMVLSLCNS